jgi:hypothetical protein
MEIYYTYSRERKGFTNFSSLGDFTCVYMLYTNFPSKQTSVNKCLQLSTKSANRTQIRDHFEIKS